MMKDVVNYYKNSLKGKEKDNIFGEMAEWLKAVVSKTIVLL